ncbi:hypothetical protein F7725_006549 [Dissostichus mawsoni]|uniref:Uncharacterized protein n=1 Tax=Dissostichus mawsoni TaxID=36200 RepID=A0A7J5XVV4_DISMA|nr:hypothetical protein F7725_006549 [Dissostichus mawsoni]
MSGTMLASRATENSSWTVAAEGRHKELPVRIMATSVFPGIMSQRTERRGGIHVDQSDLLCKNGCGYYGNAAWQALCSKCWREEYQKVRHKQIQDDWALAANHGSQAQPPPQSSNPQPGHASLGPFSKFEEKKTNEKTRKVTTVKKFFSPSSRSAPKKGSSESVEQVMDQVEKYIMTRLYKSVALHWVTIEMLCLSFDEEIPEVSENVVKAITDVIEMDSKRVPRDKLSCITRCSKHIFSAIRITKKEPASADDFLPALIYISLNLSPEEFERYMSGQASPRSSDGVWSSAPPPDPINPVLAQLNTNLEALSGLSTRQEALMEAAQSLQAELLSWPQSVQHEVTGILKKYPLEVPPRHVPAIDDNDDVDNDNLPPPLTPQICAIDQNKLSTGF